MIICNLTMKRPAAAILLFSAILLVLFPSGCGEGTGGRQILLEDDFGLMPRGPLGSELGAETEYHYLPQARPVGNWAVSTFRYNLPPSWYVRRKDGRDFLYQKAVNPDHHWHPMVVAGSPFWQDYLLEVDMLPGSSERRAGVAFRYRHDRSYYFFGLERDSVRLLLVNHGIAFREPYEELLATKPFSAEKEQMLRLRVRVEGSRIYASIDVKRMPDPGDNLEKTASGDDSEIRASLDRKPELRAVDSTFRQGRIALLADGPASFYRVRVSTNPAGYRAFREAAGRYARECDSVQAGIPKPVLYKKISTEGFGVGRNIRFGDLDGDGEIDVLIGQVVHHGFKDRNSELSCLTAMTLDGEILWQRGRPDPWKTRLTNDVAFQIHDLDRDGENEAIYCMNQELIIAEGKTGRVLKKVPTPLSPGGGPLPTGHNIFPRILGDCIYFADLSGRGYPTEIILKDRYRYIWAFRRDLVPLWEGTCRTGHYPFAWDTDGDGRQELLAGYTLFDPDGKILWSLDDALEDHADGVAIVRYREGESPVCMCAASDEGMFFADLSGRILKHHYIGHVQNPVVANFRDDLEGLETVSVNFWGNQGIIHLFDAGGNIYHSFEPNQYGSMCLPLNWTGRTEEFFVLNANVDEGGAWDGYGRRVLEFPDDGHPDMCYAVLDITGDCRDEIVVWDPHELWVYTQGDNPLTGELYRPVRNPLFNYSNYQATVSLPGTE